MTAEGRTYYVDHQAKRTTWDHPAVLNYVRRNYNFYSCIIGWELCTCSNSLFSSCLKWLHIKNDFAFMWLFTCFCFHYFYKKCWNCILLLLFIRGLVFQRTGRVVWILKVALTTWIIKLNEELGTILMYQQFWVLFLWVSLQYTYVWSLAQSGIVWIAIDFCYNGMNILLK